MSTRIYCLTNQFTPRNDISILFQGNKPLIKPRVNLDLIIALHCEQDCIEIIAYHSLLGKEAPRLYYTVPSLLSRMDQTEIANLVAAQNESSSSKKMGSINIAKYTHKIILECLKKFIFHRIDVSYENQSNQQNLSIYLRKLSKDIEATGSQSHKINLSNLKPNDVVPLQTNFLGRVKDSEEIKAFLNILENQSYELKQATKLAEIKVIAPEEFQSTLEEKRLLRMKEINDRKSRYIFLWKKAIRKVLFRLLLEKIKFNLLSPSERIRFLYKLEYSRTTQTSSADKNDYSSIIKKKKKKLIQSLILPSINKVNNSTNKVLTYRSVSSNSLTISTCNSTTITSNSCSLRNSTRSLTKSKSRADCNSNRNKTCRTNKKVNEVEDNSLLSANSLLESTHKLLDSLLEMTSHLMYTKKNN